MDKNTNFFCNECNKYYKTYQVLWKHNKKFHNGKPIEKNKSENKEYICKKCASVFDTKQKKYYHQKNCNGEPKEIVKTKEDNTEIIKQSDVINDIVVKPVTTTINNNSNNNTTINNTNNNNNNRTIIINNYSSDNLEYISDKFKQRLFKNLLDEDEHTLPLPKLIENIKFNPNHKENNNVKIKSDRSKIGFYYDQNKWKAINKNDLLDDLCNYSLKVFSNYFKEMKGNLSEDMVNQYEQFYQTAKLKTDLRNKIKDKIENIAYIFTINNEDELDV